MVPFGTPLRRGGFPAIPSVPGQRNAGLNAGGKQVATRPRLPSATTAFLTSRAIAPPSTSRNTGLDREAATRARLGFFGGAGRRERPEWSRAWRSGLPLGEELGDGKVPVVPSLFRFFI